MSDIAPIHAALWTRFHNALVSAGAYALDGKAADGEEIPKGSTGYPLPHASLYIGDDDEHPYGVDVSDTGLQNAVGILPVGVLCVGNTAFEMTQVQDIVRRAFVGWRPTDDCGPLSKSQPGYADQPVPGTLKPQRYMKTLGFSCTIGANGAAA